MKARIFGILALVSLLLFAAVTWMWLRSFTEDRALLSWKWRGDRYTLRSHWGQLVVAGPPVGEPDPVMDNLAGRMSNADFRWSARRSARIEGEVRTGCATWQMYDRFLEHLAAGKPPATAQRLWLRGLEDPRCFASSHFLLLLAGEDRWRQRWAEERDRPRLVGTLAAERMVLFIAANGSGNGPDPAQRQNLRERWHVILDEARVRMFYGWFALAALAVPIAWAARPRREPRTKARWALNILALVSALILLASSAMWARSFWTSEQWTFAARPSDPVPGLNLNWRAQRSVGSAHGRLVFHEEYITGDFGFRTNGTNGRPAGYGRSDVTAPAFAFPGARAAGEQHWKVPGAEFRSAPKQALTLPLQGPLPATAPAPLRQMQMQMQMQVPRGFRSIAISWWVIVTLSCIAPLIWFARNWMWWRRHWRMRRLREKICLHCGYDLRASQGRCPECGTEIPAGGPGPITSPQTAAD